MYVHVNHIKMWGSSSVIDYVPLHNSPSSRTWNTSQRVARWRSFLSRSLHSSHPSDPLRTIWLTLRPRLPWACHMIHHMTSHSIFEARNFANLQTMTFFWSARVFAEMFSLKNCLLVMWFCTYLTDHVVGHVTDHVIPPPPAAAFSGYQVPHSMAPPPRPSPSFPPLPKLPSMSNSFTSFLILTTSSLSSNSSWFLVYYRILWNGHTGRN